MSLEIAENNWTLVRQYWNTDTAYNDIIGDNNADFGVIIANQALAMRILSDWVWASNYRTIRYITGKIPFVRQYAYKRIYPTAIMARQALAAEISSTQNWDIETNAAQQIIQNNNNFLQILEISTSIRNYLNTRAELQNRCRNTGDYSSYYRSRYIYAALTDGAWGVLNRIMNENETDITINIAVIHDLAMLLANIPFNQPVNEFASFRRNRLAMTVQLENGNVQIVQANQIRNTVNEGIIIDPDQDIEGEGMRWTFQGGQFPDNRTIDETHPAIRYARNLRRPVQMGPSRTAAAMLHLANQALIAEGANNIETRLANLTLGLFAFWNQSYNRRCTLIHCYHFVTDCAVCNFGVQRATMNQIFNVPLLPPYV